VSALYRVVQFLVNALFLPALDIHGERETEGGNGVLALANMPFSRVVGRCINTTISSCNFNCEAMALRWDFRWIQLFPTENSFLTVK
jgi:hypothetical protein